MKLVSSCLNAFHTKNKQTNKQKEQKIQYIVTGYKRHFLLKKYTNYLKENEFTFYK